MRNSTESDFIAKENYKPWLVSGILFLFDILAICIAYTSAYYIRLGFIPIIGGEIIVESIFPVFWMTIILIVGLFFINGLYPASQRIGVVELQEIIKFVTTSFIILGLSIFVLKFGNMVSRTVFILTWFLSCLTITFFRLIIHNRGSLLPWWSQPVLIVGHKNDVENIITRLNRARRMAIKPVVCLILDKGFTAATNNGIAYFPYSANIQKEIRKSGVRQAIYVNHSKVDNPDQNDHLHLLSLSFSKLIYVLGESPLSSLSMKPIDLEGRPALQVQYNLLDPLSIIMKRFTEILFCFISLVVIFPSFLLLAILIRIDSKGPIIFSQKRIGKNGRIFNLYKFRTMQIDAEKYFEDLLRNNKELRYEYQKFHKIRNDPRITKVGRFLRKSSLDEFPQIWNVIRGEMSLVGPRAYLPNELGEMRDSAELIHRVNPGLTGWWQVMGRHDLTFEERLKLDKYYISNFSLWMDFYILLKTVWVVISGQGQ